MAPAVAGRVDAPSSLDLIQRDAVAEMRTARRGGLSDRDRLAVLVLGGGFLAHRDRPGHTRRDSALTVAAGGRRPRRRVRPRLTGRVRARERIARTHSALARADALRAPPRPGAACRRGAYVGGSLMDTSRERHHPETSAASVHRLVARRRAGARSRARGRASARLGRLAALSGRARRAVRVRVREAVRFASASSADCARACSSDSCPGASSRTPRWRRSASQ